MCAHALSIDRKRYLCSKSVFARADLAWKKRSLRNERLKEIRASETERKERLRIRHEIKLQETALATLKRLKRSDVNELERNLRLEKVVVREQLRG